MTKICRTCGEEKHVALFTRSRRQDKTPECQRCEGKRRKEWRRINQGRPALGGFGMNDFNRF